MPPHCNIGNLSRPCITVRLVLKKIYFETYTYKTEFIFESFYIYIYIYYILYIYKYIYIIYIIYIYVYIYIYIA